MAREPLNLAELLKDPVDHRDRSAALNQTEERASGEVPEVSAGYWKKHQSKTIAAFVAAVLVVGAWGSRSELVPAVGSLFRPPVASEQPVPLPDRSKQALRPERAREATLERTETALPKQAVIAAQQPSADLTAFSKPVQELMHYLEGLKRGSFSFNWGITGEEAAKQLGFTRLFASAYEEMILRIKNHAASQRAESIDEIISNFAAIVGEEQAVDKVLATRERHSAAIAYLRALQNGDVVFPGPQAFAPVPPVLLVQLMSAYPDVSFDINDYVFAAVYRQARDFASARVKAAGEVWAQEIIAEFRRLIVQSTSAVDGDTNQTTCDQGRMIGEIMVVLQFCPRLSLSDGPRSASQETRKSQSVLNCQDKAATEFKSNLAAMPTSETTKMCQVIEDYVRAGKIKAFKVAS